MHLPAQLLIINPNTSASLSAALLEHALRQAAGQCQVRVQTARLGASYISDEVSFALAGHALPDAYALHQATGMFFASWRSANPPIQQHLSNF